MLATRYLPLFPAAAVIQKLENIPPIPVRGALLHLWLLCSGFETGSNADISLERAERGGECKPAPWSWPRGKPVMVLTASSSIGVS